MKPPPRRRARTPSGSSGRSATTFASRIDSLSGRQTDTRWRPSRTQCSLLSRCTRIGGNSVTRDRTIQAAEHASSAQIRARSGHQPTRWPPRRSPPRPSRRGVSRRARRDGRAAPNTRARGSVSGRVRWVSDRCPTPLQSESKSPYRARSPRPRTLDGREFDVRPPSTICLPCRRSWVRVPSAASDKCPLPRGFCALQLAPGIRLWGASCVRVTCPGPARRRA
jgi:hypothetical protein